MATNTYNATFNDSSGLQRLDGQIIFPTATNAPTSTNGMIVRSFAITYQTASLASGVTLYTPAVGDIIYDIGVCITTAFNGTTPRLDVGTFNGGNSGVFSQVGGAVIDGTKLYSDLSNNAGLGRPNSVLWLFGAAASAAAAGTAAFNSTQLLVSAANPLLVVASQSGAKGGTAITSTAGAATIMVVTATPS